jgi:outer membrane protein assembly factor BamB
MGEGFSATYPGSRSTPTVTNNLVYTTSGMGRIACFDINTGKEIWAKNVISDLKGLPSIFGYSESLVIDENRVYCFPGGNENNTVALNRFNGEIIWSSKALLDTFSYCSPILVTNPAKKFLITHSRHHLYTLDCVTGELLSSYHIPHYQYDGEHCNSPVFYNKNIYFIGNEKEHGAVKIKVVENGKVLHEIWKNSSVKNNFNGFVVVNDKIFTTVKGNWLKALDINSGMVIDSVKTSTGSLIYTDNKFICYGMNGDLQLIDYSSGKLQKQSSFKITEGTGHHFAHPTIKNGVLYIRHGNSLLAYNISKN